MSTFLLVAGGLVASAWTFLAVRLIRKARGPAFRFLKATDQVGDELPAVVAVVPARNEEAHVEATVAALRAQDYPRLELIVVDDQSTDATGALLDRLAEETPAAHPLRVIHGVERPAGWVGKTWAMHQGVEAARGEWLWFVDADMGLDPRALRTAMVETARTEADLVSFLPGARCETFWQGAIASSFIQLLAQLFPLDRVNDPACPEAIAAGGFILVRKAAYDAAGGHEACRREILDDVKLAGKVKASGGKLTVRLAPNLAWTHMYGSFGDIWRGLRKNAYAGMDYQLHKYITGAIVALALAWLPMLAFMAGMGYGNVALVAVGLWGILAQAVAARPVGIFLKLSPAFGFSLPLGITAYVAIATASVWHHHRGRILWKGRTIAADTVVEPSSPVG
jgi:hopene-associated glycosyltransferase HpnB